MSSSFFSPGASIGNYNWGAEDLGKFSGSSIGNYDWGSQDLGKWSGGFGIDDGSMGFTGNSLPNQDKEGKALELLKVFSDALSGSNKGKYQAQAEQGSKVKFGPTPDTKGFGAQELFDGFGIYTPPPSFGPMVIDPAMGPQGRSTGQRIAGGLQGAIQGVAAGAPLGPYGMIAGGLGGAAGGFFS